MLRSLGSSLVAKSSPGGKLREIGERAITTPQIPGKGAIGTLSRGGIEEPLKREVPAGSEKVVGMQPIVESQAGLPADVIPSEVMPPAPIPEGMSPSVNASVPQGNRGQALFQGGVGGSSGGAAAGASRAATKQVSQGDPYIGYKKPVPEVQGAQTSSQDPRSVNVGTGVPFASTLGGKVYAGDTNNPVPRTAAQAVVGGLGKAVSAVPIQAVKNVGNMMQSWGGITQQAPRSQQKPAPKPSVAQGVANQLRSVVQNLFSKLRSSW